MQGSACRVLRMLALKAALYPALAWYPDNIRARARG